MNDSSDALPNVLAERYASTAMRSLWSPRGRIRLERAFWIAVLEAQRDLGRPVPAEALAAYRVALEDIDLAASDAREREKRHDVKARLEEYNARAGHELLHQGLTSRDLTENVEQLQVARALALVRDKAVAALGRLAERARTFRDLPLTARTHHVPAQPSTLGRRFAMWGEELAERLADLDLFLADYPVRGLKGAVGTQVDVLTLLGGDDAAVTALEERVLAHLGFGRALGAPGQVYPRSLDWAAVNRVAELASPAASFAKTWRLMAGLDLVSEGFAPGQVGSSAMPHKVNARSCERINGLHVLLKGYAAMAAGLAGDQWNEGDVSCSVVRRVVLPDAFLAADGLLETFLVVLDQLEVHVGAIAAENARLLPFLSTTTVLMEAVRHGAGREEAHGAIKRHALAVAADLRAGRSSSNDLGARLEADPVLRLPEGAAARILAGQRAHPLPAGRCAGDDQRVRQLSAGQHLRQLRHPFRRRVLGSRRTAFGADSAFRARTFGAVRGARQAARGGADDPV